MREEKENSQIKICGICQNKILENDDYIEVKEFHGGEFYKKYWYHILCFRKQMGERKKLSAIALNLAGRTNKLLERFEVA